MARKRGKHEFQIALSFAGENRPIAKQIHDALKERGVKVFYDRGYTAHLWGKGQTEFDRIYSSASQYVVPIISEQYAQKPWCLHEFDVAQEEAKRRSREFVLPVRLDDTKLVGLPYHTQFLDLRERDIPSVVDLVLQKLGQDRSRPPRPKADRPSKGDRARPVSVLRPAEHRALAIIACSSLPVSLDYVEQFFPHTDWAALVRSLIRKGVLRRDGRFLDTPSHISRSLVGDSVDAQPYHRSWVEVLTPLEDHVDIALALSLHHLHLGSHDDAIAAVSKLVEGIEPGLWNDLYLQLLSRLSDPRVLRCISGSSRVRLYHGIGLCLARAGQEAEAISWYLKLRRYGKRASDNWAVGRSYVECGNAYEALGKLHNAKRCCEAAIRHAEALDDRQLLAESLHNLALLVLLQDPDEAARLLQRSISVAAEAGDDCDTVSVYVARGMVAARSGEYSSAVEFFRKAEQRARNDELRYALAGTLCNLGAVYLRLDKTDESIEAFREAQSLGREDSFQGILTCATQGEAFARMQAEDYGGAASIFGQLCDLHRAARDNEGLVGSLIGLGEALAAKGEGAEARSALGRALRVARRENDTERVGECSVHYASSYLKEGRPRDAINTLRKAARQQERAQDYSVASNLWEQCVACLIECRGTPAEIENAAAAWLRCADHLEDSRDVQYRIYTQLYVWRWRDGFHESAIHALDCLEMLARRHRDPAERARAIDQKGACLQELGRQPEAAECHRKALQIARRSRDEEAVETSLANLAEHYRRIGQPCRAISGCLEAERIARGRGDKVAELSYAHNRALAEADRGDYRRAEAILRSCREAAKRQRAATEHARSIHGLANLAWVQGKMGMAEKYYRTALEHARTSGLWEMECQIRVNYAYLMRLQNRLRDASEIIRRLPKGFRSLPDSYVCLLERAWIAFECGKLTPCREDFLEAKRAATNANAVDKVIAACIGLAEVHKRRGQTARADARLQEALKLEVAPEQRTDILYRRLDILLDGGRERTARRVFEEACGIAAENDLADAFIDLHMRVADHNWQYGGNGRYSAMHAYIAAMMEALVTDPGRHVAIGMHVLRRTLALPRRKRLRDVETLLDRLSDWLRQTAGDGMAEKAGGVLLWPLRAARRISLAEGLTGGRISDTHVAKIVKSEFPPHENDS